MNYFTAYRAEFRDDLDVMWRVDIQKLAASQPNVREFVCAGDPLRFDGFADDSPFDQNIMGSQMTLNIWNDEDFGLLNLFHSAPLEFKILVYHNNVLYWR